MRTVKVSRMIDQPQLPVKSPSRPCQNFKTASQASMIGRRMKMIAMGIRR